MNREDAIELLNDRHEFPGIFPLSLIIVPEHSMSIQEAISKACEPAMTIQSAETVPSKHGNYLALRLKLWVETAEDVLHLYEVVGDLEGVKMAL